jgi:hypothetical protein
MAFGCIASTSTFASLVRKLKTRYSPSTGAALAPRVRQMPAKAASGRSSARANQVGVFRGLVSSYSQKDVNGVRQRNAGFSHPRQYGLLVLRTLVTGSLERFGGAKPQRIISSARCPSREVRTTGAMQSGKILGSGGRLPVLLGLQAANGGLRDEVVPSASGALLRGPEPRSFDAGRIRRDGNGPWALSPIRQAQSARIDERCNGRCLTGRFMLRPL